MPPRDPELPEGTDHVVAGASKTGGFVATGNSSGSDKLVSQVRDQVVGLRGQAGDKLRSFADDGKSRATGMLDNVSGVMSDAAKSVDEKLGADYGEYAHRAADAVAAFSGRVRDKTVDDLIDDTREFVRKSPGIAIGIAAVAGFALMRVIKTGLDDVSGRSAKGSGRTTNGGTGTGGN